MRTIKFRGWTERDEMVYCADFYDCSLIERNCANPPIWMQFTGLLDKNGKEIYEGDIIRRGNKLYEVVYGYRGEKSSADIMESAHYYGFCLRGKDGWLGLLLDRTGEVIGNIYENPELVKQEDGKDE